MSFWSSVPEEFLKEAVKHWAHARYGAAGLQIRVKHYDIDKFEAWVERSIYREEDKLKNDIFIRCEGATDRDACIRVFAELAFPL